MPRRVSHPTDVPGFASVNSGYHGSSRPQRPNPSTGCISVWCWICILPRGGLVESAAGPSPRRPGGVDGGVTATRPHTGCKFTSEEYQQFLAAHGTCSMSAVGSCADNAAAESFFGVIGWDAAVLAVALIAMVVVVIIRLVRT
jgi:hypothetical protein